MPFLLLYLFKLSLTLAVLYLFYYTLLRKLTFYTWNRFYLLSYSLLAVVVPFINITPWIEDRSIAASSLINKVNFINSLPAVSAIPSGEQASTLSAYDLALLLFITGAALMLTRLLLQFISIQAIKRKATVMQTNNIRLYDVDGPISPFSFARSIFVNTRRHSEEDLQKIIQHEFVHVKQQHTADLLVGELLCILNWYNPFAWLIRKAIRQNLEFVADHSVLQSGLDARQYQYLLLQVTGLPHYSLSNNFSISSLKKRIFMMNKLKSARSHLLRFLFVLPLLAVTLLAFRSQQRTKQIQNDSLYSKNLANDTVPPKPPTPPAVKVNPDKPVPPPPPPPPPSFPGSVKSLFIDATTNKVTVGLRNGKKEVYNLTRLSEKAAYEKKYGRFPPPAPVPLFPSDVIVVGKKIAKNGEKPVPPPTSPAIVDVELDSLKAPVIVDVDLDSLIIKPVAYVNTGEHEPLYVVDGVITSPAALSKIDNQWVAHVDDLEGKKATDLYGDKGANGVILITTIKNSKTAIERDESERKLMELFNKALIIVNGKEASKADVIRMLAHPPKGISMYTSEKAGKKWGDKGKNGVVMFTLTQ